MEFTRDELQVIKNMLTARRAYRYTDIPGGISIWDCFYEKLYQKVKEELIVQDDIFGLEELPTGSNPTKSSMTN